LDLRDARAAVYLLLLALYCLRGPRDPGAWTIAGLAVRLCIELGLHRKSVTGEISMERELEVRIFWSCYYLDRGISVALGKFASTREEPALTSPGRPPAISDDDIDVEVSRPTMFLDSLSIRKLNSNSFLLILMKTSIIWKVYNKRRDKAGISPRTHHLL
jgi:hypothetical protein